MNKQKMVSVTCIDLYLLELIAHPGKMFMIETTILWVLFHHTFMHAHLQPLMCDRRFFHCLR